MVPIKIIGEEISGYSVISSRQYMIPRGIDEKFITILFNNNYTVKFIFSDASNQEEGTYEKLSMHEEKTNEGSVQVFEVKYSNGDSFGLGDRPRRLFVRTHEKDGTIIKEQCYFNFRVKLHKNGSVLFKLQILSKKLND